MSEIFSTHCLDGRQYGGGFLSSAYLSLLAGALHKLRQYIIVVENLWVRYIPLTIQQGSFDCPHPALAFHRANSYFVHSLVTQPMMQRQLNPTELRPMDSYIQILFRFQKVSEKFLHRPPCGPAIECPYFLLGIKQVVYEIPHLSTAHHF